MINIFKKKPIIEFFCHPTFSGVIPEPKPAFKYIPEWYKKIPTMLEDERDNFGAKAMTAKKCMPMIDAMSLGYVIPLAGDMQVMVSPDGKIMKASDPPGIHITEHHSLSQIGGKTAPGAPTQPLKFINHWVVKTRPGYSTLFMPLLNDVGDNKHFTCLSGLVDTDKYPKEVNFPAIWHTRPFDGTLKAGTPLVVAIPIKRSDIPRQPTVRDMSDDEFKHIDKLRMQQITRNHVYTDELRESRK